ncbi:MAG: hypothetical protein HQK50_07355 [Oligoflexia bacterium]|nr:hypothetical protein [Oligoflexia bacterium]
MINLLWRRRELGKTVFAILLTLLLYAYAAASAAVAALAVETPTPATALATTAETIDFKAIKGIIKNDMLEEVVEKKNEEAIIKQKDLLKKKVDTYNFPTSEEFWTLISEYWLIKNAQKLRWDFEHPDFGLNLAVRDLFESLGHYEIKVKILLADIASPTHFALPANKDEYIFFISLPFMRAMDLSKLEIALLILEDFHRAKAGFMQQYVYEKELDEFWGKNFYNKKFKAEVFQKMLKNYSYFIFEKGFSFQQQFETTKTISAQIRTNPNLWKSYNNLLFKIDTLIKSNPTFKEYTKIYPSPEIQLQWLKASEKQ